MNDENRSEMLVLARKILSEDWQDSATNDEEHEAARDLAQRVLFFLDEEENG